MISTAHVFSGNGQTPSNLIVLNAGAIPDLWFKPPRPHLPTTQSSPPGETNAWRKTAKIVLGLVVDQFCGQFDIETDPIKELRSNSDARHRAISVVATVVKPRPDIQIWTRCAEDVGAALTWALHASATGTSIGKPAATVRPQVNRVLAALLKHYGCNLNELRQPRGAIKAVKSALERAGFHVDDATLVKRLREFATKPPI